MLSRKMVIRNIFLLFLSLSFVCKVSYCAQIDVPSEISNTAYEPVPCKTDRECPETSFCFLSKNCIKCFNCTSRHRQNRIRCARSVEDCGDCLPGFSSETYYSHVRRYCHEVISEANTAQSRLMEQTNVSLNLGYLKSFGICGLAILGLLSFYCYNHRKYRRPIPTINTPNTPSDGQDSQFNCDDSASSSSEMPPPPPYRKNEDSDDDDNVSCSFSLRVIEHSVVDQKAVPCFIELDSNVNHGSDAQQSENPLDDADVYSPFNEITNQAPSSEVTVASSEVTAASSGVTATSAYNLQIHDENTTPSFWTPGDNYGIADTGNETAQTTNGTKFSLKRKSTDENENPKKQKGG